MTALASSLAALAIGCGATSGEEQRRALTYQQNSDDAARNGQYGIADENQRKAHDAHHKAVTKAIDEGKPIPPQTKFGDVPPPPPTTP
jgi:hypothetical protein